MFATPVCVHFLPVAQEANAELRPLIVERAQANGQANGQATGQATGSTSRGEGWRSAADFELWGGGQAQTLFRVLRDLADSLTSTRTGGRLTLDWKITAAAAIRQKGEYQDRVARPGAFWSGVYYVDDGYAKSDDETLGGECELCDPRGVLPAMVSPQLGFRVPNGLTAGQTEIIRPQSGMIVLHPSFQPRGEKRFDGPGPRITVEFDVTAP